MALLASDGSEIRSIEGRIYGCEVAERFGYSQGWIDRRASAVVCLTTADGTVGWGEGYATAEATAAAIELIGRHFTGRSVFERVAVARATAERLRGLDGSGPLAAALSAVALAAGDAAAKLLGVPLRALLGGSASPRIRPYASALWFAPRDSPMAHYPDAVRRARAHGFTAVKAKIGTTPASDIRAIEAMLEAADGTEIMVDANQAYDFADAEAVARGIGAQEVTWLEEPLPPRLLGDYPALRARSRVPIAGGESIASLRDAATWIATAGVDVLQPDMCLGHLHNGTDCRPRGSAALLRDRNWACRLTALGQCHRG
jgi:D-galactarolactone cycloisomerase